jgi:hypothetical protein
VTFTAAVVGFGGDQEYGYGAVQCLFDSERTERLARTRQIRPSDAQDEQAFCR